LASNAWPEAVCTIHNHTTCDTIAGTWCVVSPDDPAWGRMLCVKAMCDREGRCLHD
jgi:hypothetical protein